MRRANPEVSFLTTREIAAQLKATPREVFTASRRLGLVPGATVTFNRRGEPTSQRAWSSAWIPELREALTLRDSAHLNLDELCADQAADGINEIWGAPVADDRADAALKYGLLRQEDIPVLAFIRRANPCRSGRISSEFPCEFRAHEARLQRLRRAGLIEYRRGYWWPVATSSRAS